MPKVCLVTGGAGFIGCAISSELADLFDRVIALDNLHPQVHPARERPAGLDPRIELIVADVTETRAWEQVLSAGRPDVVIHLAAETGTGQSLTHASRHTMVNAVGTARMLDAFVSVGHVPKRIVHASSRAVYGEGSWRSIDANRVEYPGQRTLAQLERGQWDFPGMEPLPMNAANTLPNPTSIYGVTKYTQEQMLRVWCSAYGAPLNVLRMQNVYGPGQSITNQYTGIVTLFMRLAKEGKSIPIFEDGNIGRDFIYIDDVASAFVKATQTDFIGPAYDVGTGHQTTVHGLAEIIATRYGAPKPHITGAFRHGDVRNAVAMIDQTMIDLDWKPHYSLEQGLERLVEWLDKELQ